MNKLAFSQTNQTVNLTYHIQLRKTKHQKMLKTPRSSSKEEYYALMIS